MFTYRYLVTTYMTKKDSNSRIETFHIHRVKLVATLIKQELKTQTKDTKTQRQSNNLEDER
jgi:hypothetical protein